MPRCAEASCGRWRPERLAPRWAAGIRFNDGWYCSRACVEGAARAGLDSSASGPQPISQTGWPPLRIGVLLRHSGAITEEQLNVALEAQKRTRRPVGAELQRFGFVTREQLLHALAAQAGVSYLTVFDGTRVVQGPSWLPGDTVRALGLVPFEVDDERRRVKVVCSAPVPRSAIRALHKLTGWTADVYLVADEVWDQVLKAYRPHAGREVPPEVLTLDGVDAVVAHVADAALAGRSITMRHASCERYTWVRVEGPAQRSDLLVPGAMEGICRAEPIAH